MPLKDISVPNIDELDIPSAIESAAAATADIAEDAWEEFTGNDLISECMQATQKIAEDAWETCSPALEGAADIAKAGAYLSGRTALGVVGFAEDGCRGIATAVNVALGNREHATELAQTSFVDDTAALLGEALGVSEEIESAGDVAEDIGRFAAETAALSTISVAPTAASLASGAASIASATGKSFRKQAEDGNLSDEDVANVAVDGIVATVEVASAGAVGKLLRGAGKPFAQAEKNALKEGVDDAGEVVADAGKLLPNKTFSLDGVKCRTDDAGKIYRMDDDLIPDGSYELGGYKYSTDGQGRITSASGKLQIKGHEKRTNIKDSMEIVGRGEGKDTDDRSHLIADMFNGVGRLENLVAADINVNRSELKRIELKCNSALKSDNDVFYKIEPMYSRNSNRPSSFRVTDIINGEKTVTVLDNTPRSVQ